MKNYELADVLYDSAKQTLAAIGNINYNQDSADTINDFFKIFSQLNQVALSIGIKSSYAEEIIHMSTSKILCDISTFTSFQEKYKKALKELIIDTIKYRQYVCVIRRNDEIPGLASHIITNLGQIVYAIGQGFIPVIDTANSENCFKKLSDKENRNIWEKYFRQPFDILLQDVENAPKVGYVDGIPGFFPTYKMEDLENAELVSFWHQVAIKYIPFSEFMNEKIDIIKKKLEWNEKRVLGVICRGTDYVGLKPYNHPVQPDIDTLITDASRTMLDYDCEYCYLATEDKAIFRKFKAVFGDKLLFSQSILYDDVDTKVLNKYNDENEIDIDEKNVEYLVALKLLSECTCMMGGRTSGAVVALVLSEGYEYFHLYNEGRYCIDDKKTLSTYVI